MAKRASDLDMLGNRVKNLPTPTADTDAATKKYVDDKAKSAEVVVCRIHRL